ncbi:MAG: polymerase III, subunit gamma and tau protein [Candidatus Daviesbacteria bacterium GW2011_GWA1_41_61]|uniref:DNA polymerase III subunit gamma/tau n=1 Tax=Candidatus Daviesbacteria bacterium GW2011_GWA2_40_9 TaxID=1618424 RepID=A0A0G0WG22_9BACT|nr:MAG: DNA polymerase III, subunit gamma and tau, DNA polymerase III subunit gamma/tau [Candidatus Daviesbacteria bacterium GW2011_GWC1_40_9]KKR83240.1 MAG: polymerase III, subunit gamma and tau protein [Candidatus Daviesbacteria bacterium GW2011_GWA2_40_9]KKR93585.1 MAG: polymerase III, subunit gamma and tau protein [Candidatus Daviesbacteria bacterium GW2011_GWB1_41_15]KKS14864.1 MAG: polymerase III, subunit gamma and tau protein [Candidatus Daviesbacteria bacterium GW2011_GWA1_41_61]
MDSGRVLYRKHRPQSLDELIGQSLVKQSLSFAISSGKLSHAYLLYGPRGTGKTSTARILAKIVNCESQEPNLPCNQCSSCLSITDGSSLDVIEMDAASNRGIEDIRTLRENIKLAPSSSKKKVYIIDEVHMLSPDAFNALLKTLEEPPSHVMFILATTEIQKIPQTILSRVQRLDFKLALVEELVEALSKVAEKEKIDIDSEALLLVAKKAGGSFRDGIKFLDQLSSYGKIDPAVVEEVLGAGTFTALVELLQYIVLKDSPKSLQSLIDQFSSGNNVKELTVSLLDILRQLLFIKNKMGETLVKPEVGEEKYPHLQDLASKFDLEDLLFTIDVFHKSLEQGRFVTIATLPLEVAVVESCQRGNSKLEVKSEKVKTDASAKRFNDDQKDEGIKIAQVHQKKEGECVELPPQVGVFLNEASGEESHKAESASSPLDIQKIAEKWSYILETVRQDNYSLEALLRSSKIIHCDEVGVIFEVPYTFHQRILEAPKSRDLVESILSDILARPVKISTALAKKKVEREELANVEVAADDEIIRIASEIFNSETVN